MSGKVEKALLREIDETELRNLIIDDLAEQLLKTPEIKKQIREWQRRILFGTGSNEESMGIFNE